MTGDHTPDLHISDYYIPSPNTLKYHHLVYLMHLLQSFALIAPDAAGTANIAVIPDALDVPNTFEILMFRSSIRCINTPVTIIALVTPNAASVANIAVIPDALAVPNTFKILMFRSPVGY